MAPLLRASCPRAHHLTAPTLFGRHQDPTSRVHTSSSIHSSPISTAFPHWLSLGERHSLWLGCGNVWRMALLFSLPSAFSTPHLPFSAVSLQPICESAYASAPARLLSRPSASLFAKAARFALDTGSFSPGVSFPVRPHLYQYGG